MYNLATFQKLMYQETCYRVTLSEPAICHQQSDHTDLYIFTDFYAM
jgi:hypothetical protein